MNERCGRVNRSANRAVVFGVLMEAAEAIMRLATAVAISIVVIAAATSTRSQAADDPIASLNRAIQERFATVDKFFGARRITTIDDTPHRFRPETVSEESAVHDLREARLTVVLYLAGRRVLEREPNLVSDEPTQIDRRVIFGPVAVTPSVAAVRELPHAVDLLDEARNAFRELQHNDRYEFGMQNWKFSGRAIRVTSESCLTCHKGRQPGDTLGVALYAYR
jgi:hypothetical protein